MASFLKWPAAAVAPVLLAGVVTSSSGGVAETPRIAMLDVSYVASVETLLVDGTYGFGFEGKMEDKLRGVACQAPYECTEVHYNNWVFAPVSAGTKALDAAVVSTHGKKLVFAYSRGALATLEWIDANPELASDDEMAFVFIGNPARKYGGSQAEKSQDFNTAGAHIIDISTEHDSVSDVHDKRRGTWFGRMLARSNERFSQHLSYDEVDMSRPDLLVYTEQNPGGGTTTYVLVPVKNLPMLDGIRWFAPKLADKLQERWKPLIDATRDRSMFKPAGPGGVKLPFADEESTMVEMANDETVHVMTPEPMSARTANPDTVQPSDSEQVFETVVDESEPVQLQTSMSLGNSAPDELLQDDGEQNQNEGSELEPEPELEIEFESESELDEDQELDLSNEEEESELERELESALEEESENESEETGENSGNQSLNDSDEGDNEEGEESSNDDDNDSPDTSGDE